MMQQSDTWTLTPTGHNATDHNAGCDLALRALEYMRTTNDVALLEQIAREQTDSVIQAAFWAMIAEYAVQGVQAVGGEVMAG